MPAAAPGVAWSSARTLFRQVHQRAQHDAYQAVHQEERGNANGFGQHASDRDPTGEASPKAAVTKPSARPVFFGRHVLLDERYERTVEPGAAYGHERAQRHERGEHLRGQQAAGRRGDALPEAPRLP